jgi:hypothetical protein
MGLVLAWRQRRTDDEWPLGLPLSWFALSFAVLSFVGSKRVGHLAPIVPAASMLVAVAIVRAPRLTAWTAGVTGALILLGMVALLMPFDLPDAVRDRRVALAAAGLGLAAASGLAAFLAARRRPWAATVALFLVFTGGTAAWFHGVPELATASPAARVFCARALEETPKEVPLLVMRVDGLTDTVLFRLGRAEPPARRKDVIDMLESHPVVYVITYPEGERRLKKAGLSTRLVYEHSELGKKPYFRLLEVTR